ncbi:MAG: AAA family ATPase [Gammaproteobacteria bacterium]|nr:AAA family ATPase [Gammaproteobacteria bacterium]
MNRMLKSIDINNFRSIRGQIHAPLDAKVILVHGENGAGKTSLLSAIELALTGKVQSLERVDPSYDAQLLHRSSDSGSVSLQILNGAAEERFSSQLRAEGARPKAVLSDQLATFFRERAFLPQSLLGQLLQIYQDAGSDAASPLAQFVAKLLGLDRLDSLEGGLKFLADVRNVRRHVDGWLDTENQKSFLESQLTDKRKIKEEMEAQIQGLIDELTKLCVELELSVAIEEKKLDQVAAVLSLSSDSEAFAQLTDRQRQLASIQREIQTSQDSSASDTALLPSGIDNARSAFELWEKKYGGVVATLRRRVEGVLENASFPSSPEQFAESALKLLGIERIQIRDRVSRARADIERYVTAQEESDAKNLMLKTIDEEMDRLSNNAGSLGAALAEISSFIIDESCPVCDRDFREVSQLPLSDHVHGKVRMLSSSAERLLSLGRARSDAQVIADRLSREIETISARKLDEKSLVELDRRLGLVENLINEIDSIIDALQEGGRLRAADVAVRRAVFEAETRSLALATARETLNDFALTIHAEIIADDESLEVGAARLNATLASRAKRLESRLSMRRRGTECIENIHSAIMRRDETDQRISKDNESLRQVNRALERAKALRDQGNAIRNAVDTVRSSIIRREFNDRLNLVWRDLFVRLAPAEPFVPAFRIPESSTQKLQPKLVTEHREGGEGGGAPGAMLSAGNLNTAALTLFIALHLAVPRELPWLILDDPVQSMDDVHIAQLAALLRTLSKEHGRQLMIAVHDRQLFEYLKLELSPAFPDDSLITLELSRGQRRDSVCISRRFSFRQETAINFVA